MKELFFGTAGIPHSSRQRSTVAGIERIAELGLGCLEIEFVRGVSMGESTARQVAQVAERLGIKLSVHAPYFINFNAHEPQKIKVSQKRLLKAARMAALCGAASVVFHAAFYLGDSPEKTYSAVKEHLGEVLNELRAENNPVCLRPEVTGKNSQFGTMEEVINLCSELGGLAPAIDLAHWHARTKKFNSYEELAQSLDTVRQRLGEVALENMHIHFSGIAYGEKGEIKHLNLKESDSQYLPLLQALKDYSTKGLVICESPNLEEGALLLKTSYDTLLNGTRTHGHNA